MYVGRYGYMARKKRGTHTKKNMINNCDKWFVNYIQNKNKHYM